MCYKTQSPWETAPERCVNQMEMHQVTQQLLRRQGAFSLASGALDEGCRPRLSGISSPDFPQRGIRNEPPGELLHEVFLMCYRGQIKAVLKSETNTVNVEHFKQPVLLAWLKADILLARAEPAWDCSGAGEHWEPSSAWD